MYGAGLAQAGRAMQSRHRHHVRPEGPSATSVASIASVPAQTRAVPDAAARAGLVRALIARFSRGEAQGRKQPVGLDLG
jgi:hypothetical protein